MKCPRNYKNCSATKISYAKNTSQFICSGICKTPEKYLHDNVKLCFKGSLSDREIEMTVEEALFIISGLTNTLGFLAPAVCKIKKRLKK